MNRVFVCSKYSGDIENNTDFARLACEFVCKLGKAPLAPHLLYPQFLNDHSEEEREMGINSGLQWLMVSDEMWVFYEGAKLEWSNGMEKERVAAHSLNKAVRVFWYDEDDNFVEVFYENPDLI